MACAFSAKQSWPTSRAGKASKNSWPHSPASAPRSSAWDSISIGADWILEILRQRSGELLVLHGVHAKGFRVAYENISNCFHLFTLLQAALEGRMPGSKKTSPKTMEAARGKITAQDARDDAWWHYGQGTEPKAELKSMIFGEANPDSIAQIDGEQVILLWPTVMERGWDGGFFSPTLQATPPDVQITGELSGDELRQWRERLGLTSNARSQSDPMELAAVEEEAVIPPFQPLISSSICGLFGNFFRK